MAFGGEGIGNCLSFLAFLREACAVLFCLRLNLLPEFNSVLKVFLTVLKLFH